MTGGVPDTPATPPPADRQPPLIGVTSYVEPVDRGDWRGQACALVPHDYVRAVEAAGGVPVLLAPRADLTDAVARQTLARLDGLLVTGGADLDPAIYDRPPHPATGPLRPDRDHAEVLLVRAARDLRIPVLGVCRGMQVMAVQAGGALEQHLPDRVGHSGHGGHIGAGSGAFGREEVALVAGTRLAALLGPRVGVPCYHHQAVTEHPGYDAAARADDGTLEAIEDPAARFCVGVQWHPEASDDPRLFRALVAAAAERADRRDWAPPPPDARATAPPAGGRAGRAPSYRRRSPAAPCLRATPTRRGSGGTPASRRRTARC